MALSDNLVSYWKLDESSGNAADSVGSNTLTNNNTVGFTSGLINNCADLGNANNNKNFTRTDDCGIKHLNATFSAWVKIETEPSSGESQGITLIRTNTSSNYIDWFITYANIGGTKKLLFHRNKPGIIDVSTTHNVNLGTSNWHHIAMTYDTITLRGYLDGILVASVATEGVGIGGANTTSIGGFASDDGSNGYVKGFIDEVGIWSRAITSSEVTELYNSGSGMTYPFNVTYTLTAETGTFTLTGQDADLNVGFTMTAETGTFTLTGFDAVLSRTGTTWTKVPKPTTTWTKTSKPSTTWTKVPKT